jgi:hypothetical protein
MRKRRHSRNPADPITNIQELTRMSFDLQVKLINHITDKEKTERKFWNAVLFRLSKIETILIQAHALQLVQYWPDGKVAEKQREKWVQEVQERISEESKRTGMKTIEYIYGQDDEGPTHRDRRKKWTNWEI